MKKKKKKKRKHGEEQGREPDKTKDSKITSKMARFGVCSLSKIVLGKKRMECRVD